MPLPFLSIWQSCSVKSIEEVRLSMAVDAQVRQGGFHGLCKVCVILDKVL